MSGWADPNTRRNRGWAQVQNPFAIRTDEIEHWSDDLAFREEMHLKLEKDHRTAFMSQSSDLPIRKGEVGKGVTREELLRREAEMRRW
jgi:hypothetical protein